MENRYEMVAKTFEGLEEVLRDELIALGALKVEIGTRMVSFEGDLTVMYKANLCCRSALRILKPIFKFSATDPDELYDAVREYDWERFLGPDSTFSIDSTVHSNEFRHSKYVTYRVKDGIADHFRDKGSERPSVRLTNADLMLNVHIFETQITISLDSSGEPLCHRGYRVEQTKAPINEVLAAGILLKTGWRGDMPLLDPMCGSGTFLIEAALIAANINPGIYRKGFAFEKWPDFDDRLLEEIYNDDSAERKPPCPIMGGDIDPEAVGIAKKNIANARLGEYISVKCQSISDWTENNPEGLMVMNPPYGERLKPEKMEELYKEIGRCLKENFKGWHAWIIGYKDEHFDAIRLKPSVKYPLFNGSLHCSLREFVMFDGRYSDFISDGGNMGKERYRKEREEREERNRNRSYSGRMRADKKPRPFRRDNDEKPTGETDRRFSNKRFSNKRGDKPGFGRGNKPRFGNGGKRSASKPGNSDEFTEGSVDVLRQRSKRGWK